MQLMGAVLFSVHFLMLGVVVGGILNIIAVARAIVFSNREKFRADSIIWTALFCLGFCAAYVLNFTLFGGEPLLKSFIIELLPVVGMVTATVGMFIGSAKSTRFSFLVCSPCWLVYNCFTFSIGGIICEAVSLCSIIIGIYRCSCHSKYQK